LVGQGATEYLVLLAVVLIVALVSVALLGFFPGMASDAQITQSQIYWQSATPIAITEWAAKAYSADGSTRPYIRIKNTGMYPIRLTAIVGGDGGKAITFYGNGCGITSAGYYNISDYYYLAPGEEKYFNAGSRYGLACDRTILLYSYAAQNNSLYVNGASSVCANSTSSPGSLMLPSMGFEYIQYMEGQQITKRQMGKQVIIKCLPPA